MIPFDGIVIDVSEAQGDIDWPLVRAADIEFTMIRATQGRNYVDAKFARNAALCGLPHGFYHALTAGVPGKIQAGNFLRTIAQYPGAVAWAVDVELAGVTSQQVYDFATGVEAWINHPCAIYTIASTWRKLIADFTSLQQRPLWLAQWTNAPQPDIPDYWLWQYAVADAGEVPGIGNHRCDLNKFHP